MYVTHFKGHKTDKTNTKKVLFLGSRVEAGMSGSQVSQFQEFLLRANKYNTLDIFGGGIATKRIVMVEVSVWN